MQELKLKAQDKNMYSTEFELRFTMSSVSGVECNGLTGELGL
jgi:hypothetical protein